MSDNQFHKILELRQMQVRRTELEAELRSFLEQLVKSNRLFGAGETVAIYDHDHKLIGQGIVTKAWSEADLSDYSVGRLYHSSVLWEEATSRIRYRVMAIKKDGTMSSRRAFGKGFYSPTPNNDYSFYIKKIN